MFGEARQGGQGSLRHDPRQGQEAKSGNGGKKKDPIPGFTKRLLGFGDREVGCQQPACAFHGAYADYHFRARAVDGDAAPLEVVIECLVDDLVLTGLGRDFHDSRRVRVHQHGPRPRQHEEIAALSDTDIFQRGQEIVAVQAQGAGDESAMLAIPAKDRNDQGDGRAAVAGRRGVRIGEGRLAAFPRPVIGVRSAGQFAEAFLDGKGVRRIDAHEDTILVGDIESEVENAQPGRLGADVGMGNAGVVESRCRRMGGNGLQHLGCRFEAAVEQGRVGFRQQRDILADQSLKPVLQRIQYNVQDGRQRQEKQQNHPNGETRFKRPGMHGPHLLRK